MLSSDFTTLFGQAPEIISEAETSLDQLSPSNDGDWERYILGVIWAFGDRITTGLDILVDGRVALGAGLSSSAALECSIAIALNQLFTTELSLPELARLAQRSENDYVGMPCGIMDQSVSLMAQAGSALLLDCRDLSTEQIPFDLTHVVNDIARVHQCVELLKRADFKSVGEILTQSHASLRDLFEISCPELDLAVATALANKSLGGRMIGGGFGGSAIALFKVADIDQAKVAISAAFKSAGFTEPRFFTSLPSSGAAVISN